jgi:3-hydroxyacyl-[acyl-carrier-protein] dehydratase
MSRDEILDIQAILVRLPHRYPFLLLDRVTECVPGERISAIKNVSINEPFFQGHFPGRPLMPGVLIIEAMAQATGILTYETAGGSGNEDIVYYFVGIDKARFKRPVEPGDQLVLRAQLLKSRQQVWRFAARAEVDGELSAEAELMCAARPYGARGQAGHKA